MASHFGIGRTTDAYVFALAVTTFGAGVVAGVVEHNVLPAAQAAALAGRDSMRVFVHQTARQAIAAALLLYVPVILLATCFLHLRSSWTAEQRTLATVVMLELAVLVVLIAWNSVHAACLYSCGMFTLPTATQAFRSLVPLAALSQLGSGPNAVEGLAALMIIGEGLRSIALVLGVRRALVQVQLEGPPAAGTGVWRVAAPHALNMVMLSSSPLIDRMVAASLAAGAVTTLDLGERVFFVPVLIITSSIVLVAGARWAGMSARGDFRKLEEDYYASLRLAVKVSLALLLGTVLALLAARFVLGDRIAGSHTGAFVGVTALMLVSLPFSAMAALSGRLLTATRHTRSLPAFAIAVVVTNLVCDLIGVHLYGLFGVAAGTVVSQAGAAIAFVLFSRRLLRRLSPVAVVRGSATTVGAIARTAGEHR